MSKIVLAPNASGTGTLTIAAPDTSTNRTLTLPDNSGTVQTQLDQGFSFRNRIINGDMRIDQRNNGASVTITATSTGQYVLDRFYLRAESASGSKISVQRSTVAPAGFTNSMLLTSLSAYTLGASEHFGTTQAIEGFNVADLGWGTANAQNVTFSFWVRSSLTGTFGGHFANSAVNRCFVFSYTINAANTWEYKTITVPGDTSGTWLTNNGIGMYLSFVVAAGSSTTTSAGSWSSTFNRSATGQTSLVGTSGATFYITGVQLEAGSVATAFERRPYGTELALCQRYYQVSSSGCGWVNSATGSSVFLPFFCRMRAAPSATLVNSTNTFLDSAVAQRNITGISSIANIGDATFGAKMDINHASTTTGKVALIHPGAFAFSAEL